MDYFQRFWEFITSCNCINCADESRVQGDERTHLLSDPINSSPAIRRTNSDTNSNDFSQSLPKRDDQNALCRLVQNTAINMIDVGAMDSHNLEHQEYHDRINNYSSRLQQQWSRVNLPGKIPKGILKDVSNIENYILQNNQHGDIFQIRDVLMKTNAALLDIRINQKDSIVVPFSIP